MLAYPASSAARASAIRSREVKSRVSERYPEHVTDRYAILDPMPQQRDIPTCTATRRRPSASWSSACSSMVRAADDVDSQP